MKTPFKPFSFRDYWGPEYDEARARAIVDGIETHFERASFDFVFVGKSLAEVEELARDHRYQIGKRDEEIARNFRYIYYDESYG